MKTYKNVAVWDASRSSAEFCDVQTEGGKFVKILPAGSINSGCAYECRGKMAMLPGFVNAHGHAPMTLLRGLGEELPLMDWLRKRVWPVENRMQSKHMKLGTELAMVEMLATGTTCYAEMYFDVEDIPQTAVNAGMRVALSRGLQKDTDRDRLAENIAIAKEWSGASELVTVQLGPHAVYTISREYIEKVVAAALEYDIGVQMHWLETEGEWSLCDCCGEMSPEEYLMETGLSAVKHLTLAHGCWIEDDAADFYAADNISIVHCPKSNMKLGSGTAPVPKLLKSGVAVALGTDGAASNNRLDMWDEVRFAALLHKSANLDPTLLSSSEVLKMATINGARALEFENVGLIREGWAADMLLVDLDQPHYVGWNCGNLSQYIVYAGSSSDIRATIVAGEPLYQDGRFLTLDRDRIISDAAEARRELTGK